jgi:glycosyltransferase involved in cell wall biosynthesis
VERATLDLLYVGRVPPHPGGSAVVASQLLAGLAARGHRVRVLAPITAEGRARGDAFARAHPRLAVERYLVPHFATARERTSQDEVYRHDEGEALARVFPRLVARRRPDLVVTGQESVGWHVPALAQAAGVPSVALVHGGSTFMVLFEQQALPADADRLLAELAQANRVIAVARHLADTLGRRGLGRVDVIPNAVDLALFRPGPADPGLRARLELGVDDVVVAQVSKLMAIKRPLDTVGAAALALREYPKLVYVMVGDGAARAAVEAACRQHGVAARFRFAGWVDHTEVPGYLRLADLVVIPSDHEGCSLAQLEAQACGRVLLASDIPAAREVIADGESGLLFRRGDLADFAAQTLRAVSDPALRQRIGAGARRAAERRGLEGALARYEAVFREVAAGPAPARRPGAIAAAQPPRG